MFASDLFLHFVFDNDNDPHFTASMLELSPERYLWYELRRSKAADNALFLSTGTDGRIRISVYDSDSHALLSSKKQKLFSIERREAVNKSNLHRTLSPEELGRTEPELLHWLFDEACPRKNKVTALVFTPAAFLRLYRQNNTKIHALAAPRITSPRENSILVLRMPTKADQLSELLLSGPDVSGAPRLTDIFQDLRDAVSPDPNSPREELMHRLEHQLGRSLLRFDLRPGEVYSLLLRQALADPNTPDSIGELMLQSSHLDKCSRSRTGLLEPQHHSERFTPLSRRELANRLSSPIFRENLRQEAADCSAGMEPLWAMPEPKPEPPFPAFQDNLSVQILGLNLPEQYLSKEVAEQKLEQAKRDLTTLWNKPRNQAVANNAILFCTYAQDAIKRQDWNTLSEMLKILSFCGRQICAPEDQQKLLDQILENGKLIFRHSSAIHDHDSSLISGTAAKLIDNATIDSMKVELKIFIENTSSMIARFGVPKISYEELNAHIEQTMQRQQQSLEEVQRNVQAARNYEQEKQTQAEHAYRVQQYRSRQLTDAEEDALDSEDFSELNIGNYYQMPDTQFS